MRITRTSVGVGLLAVEAALGVLGVLVHYGFTAEYGDITDSAYEGLVGGFTSGLAGVALTVVAVPAAIALAVSRRPWLQVTSLALPVLVVLGMYAVTPYALLEKREVQYDATPQCVPLEDMGPGPGARATQESQVAFNSIDHVGYFAGGGGSGVGGCDRRFVLRSDVDVLAHYRGTLDDAGWRVVEDDGEHLRAQRGDLAFEVVVCGRGGVVWAGPVSLAGGAQCDSAEEVGLPNG